MISAFNKTKNMQTIKITTGKATIVVVDMPEGSTGHIRILGAPNRTMIRAQIISCANGTSKGRTSYFVKHNIPQGHWKLFGHLSQVTEDKWQDIVDVSDEGFECWNYEENDWGYHGFDPESSGLSLLRANGVLLENPVTVDLTGNNELNCDYAEWQTFESQVWKNPYIFIKL
ncbi:hypothetical protein ACR79T_10090 [Sphingobacterium spiritivorum]|uniref:hypothetical protein n=1 Tax=Sphingobacterium spiritivorum TaxID=258 RepID=UPI003DA3F09C